MTSTRTRRSSRALVAQMRREPAAFRGADDLARVSGLGAAKLDELFRLHFHSTPAQILARARVEAAQRLLLTTDRTIADVAFEVGYEGLSTFNADFRRLAAMSPAAYRRLLGAAGFRIALPASYSTAPALEYLGRDAKSLTMRVQGRSSRDRRPARRPPRRAARRDRRPASCGPRSRARAPGRSPRTRRRGPTPISSACSASTATPPRSSGASPPSPGWRRSSPGAGGCASRRFRTPSTPSPG